MPISDSSSARPEPDRAEHEDFKVAPLHGRFVLLRPISPEDYRFLRTADLGGELGVRWRYRGATMSPEQWAQSLWQSTLAQYLVLSVHDPAPLGLVAVYNAQFQDDHASLAVEKFAPTSSNPLLIFGVALFIEYVFTCWNFHKLYLEVAEYNLGQFESGIGRMFELEGRLREHLWYGDRRWDQLFLALYRETWRRESGGLLAAARPREDLKAEVQMPASWSPTFDGR